MVNKFIFDANISNYNTVRPNYPSELYSDIFKYIGNTQNMNAIEIGIGTGQATKPFLDKKFYITAVEIGENFVNSVREKFSEYSNFNAVCGDFMNVSMPLNNYDLIYSATAFHWLPDEKYQRAMTFLKSGGVIALFWNRPFVRNPDDLSNIKNAEVYDKYFEKSNKSKQFSQENTLKIRTELIQNGFQNVICKLYKRMRILSTKDYIKLLNTYSDHCSLPKDIKNSFEADMVSALRECGNQINIYDTIDLYLGKKS